MKGEIFMEENLKVIEGEIVPIYENNTGERLINARELKEIVSNRRDFSDWISRNIDKNELIENQDYYIENNSLKITKNIKANKIEYFFTKEAAKKILLSQRKSKLSEKIKKQLPIEMELL